MESIRVAPAAAVLATSFDRYFAAKQVTSDVFGTTLGMLVYLSLIPSLAALHRPDLAAAAVACAVLCQWPLALSRLAPRSRRFYIQHRDYLLVLHSIFHYGMGGQFASHVRLSSRLGRTSTAGFLASFLLSSTVPWQGVDSLMYRMRYHRFVLVKPLILLSVLPLEWRLCQLTCAARPDQAHTFGMAADAVGMLLAPFRPLGSVSGLESSSLSCFKVQAFLLLMLSWAVPSLVLRRLERHTFAKFVAQQAQLQPPSPEGQAVGAGLAAATPAAAHEPALCSAEQPSFPAAAAARAAAAAAAAAGAAKRQPEALSRPPAVLFAAVLLPATVLLPAMTLCVSGAGAAVSVAAATAAVGLAIVAAAPFSCGPLQHLQLLCSSSTSGQVGRLRHLWGSWLQQEVGPECWEDDAEGGGSGILGLMGWPAWALPVMLAALCWHTIDALLWERAAAAA